MFQSVRIARTFHSIAFLMLACVGAASGRDSVELEAQISGTVSSEQRRDIAAQIEAVVFFAKHPDQLTLAAANAASHVTLVASTVGCTTTQRHYKHCNFYNPNRMSPQIMTLTSLYTLTDSTESDHGAYALWQIDSKRACVAPSLIASMLHVDLPVSVQPPMREAFTQVSPDEPEPEVYDYLNLMPARPQLRLRIIARSSCVQSIDLRAED